MSPALTHWPIVVAQLVDWGAVVVGRIREREQKAEQIVAVFILEEYAREAQSGGNTTSGSGAGGRRRRGGIVSFKGESFVAIGFCH